MIEIQARASGRHQPDVAAIKKCTEIYKMRE
jgi:hypothetical protein